MPGDIGDLEFPEWFLGYFWAILGSLTCSRALGGGGIWGLPGWFGEGILGFLGSPHVQQSAGCVGAQHGSEGAQAPGGLENICQGHR